MADRPLTIKYKGKRLRVGDIGRAVGAHGEIIREDDGLAIQQEWGRSVGGAVEERVDQCHQPRLKSDGGVIPLPVPVGMRHHQHRQRRDGATDGAGSGNRRRRFWGRRCVVRWHFAKYRS